MLQGGLYNTLLRALERLGLADVFGASQVPLYVLNVTYPLVPAELAAFAEGKRALLVVEEGQPEYLEQSIGLALRQAGLATEVIGKGPFPRAGEYTGAVMRQGLEAFVERYRPEVLRPAAHARGQFAATRAGATAAAGGGARRGGAGAPLGSLYGLS